MVEKNKYIHHKSFLILKIISNVKSRWIEKNSSIGFLFLSISNNSFPRIVISNTEKFDEKLVKFMVAISESRFFGYSIEKQMNFIDRPLKRIVGLILDSKKQKSQQKHHYWFDIEVDCDNIYQH